MAKAAATPLDEAALAWRDLKNVRSRKNGFLPARQLFAVERALEVIGMRVLSLGDELAIIERGPATEATPGVEEDAISRKRVLEIVVDAHKRGWDAGDLVSYLATVDLPPPQTTEATPGVKGALFCRPHMTPPPDAMPSTERLRALAAFSASEAVIATDPSTKRHEADVAAVCQAVIAARALCDQIEAGIASRAAQDHAPRVVDIDVLRAILGAEPASTGGDDDAR